MARCAIVECQVITYQLNMLVLDYDRLGNRDGFNNSQDRWCGKRADWCLINSVDQFLEGRNAARARFSLYEGVVSLLQRVSFG